VIQMEEIRFGGLWIAFDDRVLRPRRWTSAQSYWAADLLRSSPQGPVLELCAGVGHIGLLAVTFQPRDLVLVDLDEGACAFARRNVAANPLSSAVDVRQGRVDEVLHEHERFAGIIADPPWVPSRDVGRFPEDPLTAIDGGEDGMSVAWSCLDVMGRHLADDGWGLIQLGTTAQAAAVADRLDGSPGLRLEAAEVREYGERGVLVHLARTP
jgi:methylase of polypeptide subunit release factors